jgi:hypothetical protein
LLEHWLPGPLVKEDDLIIDAEGSRMDAKLQNAEKL